MSYPQYGQPGQPGQGQPGQGQPGQGQPGGQGQPYQQPPQQPYQQQQQPQQQQQYQQPYQQQQPPQGGYAPVPAQQHAPAAAGYGENMKRRSPVAPWLLPMVTFGIYGLVWFFKVHKELALYDRRIEDKSTMALMSAIFGIFTLFIWPLVVFLKLAGLIGQAQQSAGLQPSCSAGLGFLLGLFGFGSLYYQIELNKVVDRYGDTPPGQQVPLAG